MSVPSNPSTVHPDNLPETLGTSTQLPIRGTTPVYPFVMMLGRAEMDSGLFCLRTRLLVALQQAYGATFGEWTAPLSVRALARHFGRAPKTVRNALQDLERAGYVERHYVSAGSGGGVYQYRLVAPVPGWQSIASSIGG